jgi:hypothetical protein
MVNREEVTDREDAELLATATPEERAWMAEFDGELAEAFAQARADQEAGVVEEDNLPSEPPLLDTPMGTLAIIHPRKP